MSDRIQFSCLQQNNKWNALPKGRILFLKGALLPVGTQAPQYLLFATPSVWLSSLCLPESQPVLSKEWKKVKGSPSLVSPSRSGNSNFPRSPAHQPSLYIPWTLSHNNSKSWKVYHFSVSVTNTWNDPLINRKYLFWLMVSEVLVHDQLAPLFGTLGDTS